MVQKEKSVEPAPPPNPAVPAYRLTAKRVLAELKRNGDVRIEGTRVTRLQHALQAATRAYRDKADDDWIVAALLHDVGDGLAPSNHDRFSAELLRPFVREEVSWVVEHHGIFHSGQSAERYSWDCDAHIEFSDHRFFKSCAEFSRRWDQPSFDPNFPIEPLETFEQTVIAVFGRAPYDPKILRSGKAQGLPATITTKGS